MNIPEYNLSKHALVRSSQRGISSTIIDLLLSYGNYSYRHGARVYYFDHKSQKRLRSELPKSELINVEKKIRSFAVISPKDNTVITVGVRFKRIWK